jgi:hypothetical protein
VHIFPILDIKTLVDVDEVTKPNMEVVAGNFVDLDPALFYVIRAQANQDRVPLFFTTIISQFRSSCNISKETILNNDGVLRGTIGEP